MSPENNNSVGASGQTPDASVSVSDTLALAEIEEAYPSVTTDAYHAKQFGVSTVGFNGVSVPTG